ncbi:DUF262 domain-containing protein [Prosthecomicrobium sp. N25]|uniref:DUF262 domain-containing protein n=1 Tax=Prosthecomicrobium sp. N25 TaxID=3129254 RepID=UPI003077A5D5
MPYTATTISNVVEKINRSYFLPAIQRPFVWDPEQVVALFDSLLKGYPISSFLFWDIARENRQNWQIYRFAENFRFGEIHNEIAETDGRDVTLVLDGQQRLTSLLIGLRGSFTVKSKWKRWENPDAWQRKRLYLDLLIDPSVPIASGEDDIEGRYGLQLLEKAPRSNANSVWIKVGDILDYPGEEAFDRYKDTLLDSISDRLTRSDERTMTRNIDRLYRMVWKDEIICYYTEKDQDYDRVLGIFVRANDGGTKLSKSDLMLSVITSKWSDISARDEIYGLVETINGGLERKNDVSKDFIMKSCLLLNDLDHVYKIANFHNKNLDIMRASWRSVKRTLIRTFTLINRLGIDRENLTSLNALMPIAYFLHKSERDLTERETPENIRDIARIRRWLISALLNRVFGGQSDSTLGVARSTIASSLTTNPSFPLGELNNSLTRHLKRQAGLTGETIDAIFQFRYGQKLVFLVLSLLYDDRNWGSVPHHVDHIFPASTVNRRALMGQNIPFSVVERVMANVDRIGNLQLLTAGDNISKSNESFDKWIRTRDQSFMIRHLIPTDQDLWSPTMLPEFVRQRELLIRSRIESLNNDSIAAE